jgi:uncharacterized protein (DUF934 family)
MPVDGKSLVKNGTVVEDAWTPAGEASELPATGAVIVPLSLWKTQREELIARGEPLGLRLESGESPEEIGEDVAHFELIALVFPGFADGRAYSYARLIRDRYQFKGELRATGDVLLEQLHFMDRVGFDAFELSSEHAAEDWITAGKDIDIWYQPTGDGRKTTRDLLRKR